MAEESQGPGAEQRRRGRWHWRREASALLAIVLLLAVWAVLTTPG
jgi:hypothetical protein